MRYNEYMNRSMDKLTPDAWESLLTATETPSIQRMVLADCPCCRSVMAIEFAVSVRTVIDRCEIHATPDDDDALPLTFPADAADDTQIELAALTHTELIAV